MYCRACRERLPLSARVCFACGAAVDRTGPGPAVGSPPTPPYPARILQATPLRDRPFASARAVVTLDPGCGVTVQSEQWAFAQVETATGGRGFVAREALAAVLAPAAIEEAPPVAAPRSRPAPRRRPVQPVDIAPNPNDTPAAEPAPGALAPPGPIVGAKRPKRNTPAVVPTASTDLPFGIPGLEGEEIRFRAVFLYNPLEDQALVVTNRRLILTGGVTGSLPRVLHLDEVEAVRLRDSGSGATTGEGNLYISVTGLPAPLHVGGVHSPHLVRNEILAACTDLHRPPASGRRRRTA